MSEAPSAKSSPILLTLTAQIVAAHLSGNKVEVEAVPALIAGVHDALSSVGKVPAIQPERPQLAVSIKKSVQPDHLVCLEDSAKVTMLKRYIAKRFNLTPAQYRKRWGLPSDYPMVAPAYAARRSTLAKESGLGRKAAPAPVPEPVKTLLRRVGRPKGSGRRAAVAAE